MKAIQEPTGLLTAFERIAGALDLIQRVLRLVAAISRRLFYLPDNTRRDYHIYRSKVLYYENVRIRRKLEWLLKQKND